MNYKRIFDPSSEFKGRQEFIAIDYLNGHPDYRRYHEEVKVKDHWEIGALSIFVGLIWVVMFICLLAWLAVR
jgi:hypothetical protein